MSQTSLAELLRLTSAPVAITFVSARTAASFGCVGNCVYTGADDTEATSPSPARTWAPSRRSWR